MAGYLVWLTGDKSTGESWCPMLRAWLPDKRWIN